MIKTFFEKNKTDVKNKSDLDDAVDRIPYNGKGTNTGKALREVVRNAFIEDNGDRPNVQNQVNDYFLDKGTLIYNNA